eukprot:PhM_4_TR6497/c0_g1_i1/m.61601
MSRSAACYRCGLVGHYASACTSSNMNSATTAAAGGEHAPVPADLPRETCLSAGNKIRELYADLMTCPDNLCHCVSECLAMGKGIAVLFKQRFGGVDELKAQRAPIGGVAVLKRGDQYVYYLITKQRYFHKPTYDDLRRSLVAMREHMVANNVHSVSMPQIGCGLDGLKWDAVQRILVEVFDQSPIDITVCHFQPAKQMRSRDGSKFV